MKGLLKKDWYMLLKIGKLYLIFDLIYAAWAAVADQTMICAMINVIFGSMIVKTLMAYEEQSKWDTFAVNLPISEKTLVREKYLMGFVCILAINLITFLVLWFMRTFFHKNMSIPLLPFFFLYFVFGMLYVAFQLPVLFKYGTVKGRLVYMVVVALGAGVAGGVNTLFLAGMEKTGELSKLTLTPGQLTLAAVALTIITAAVIMLSMELSARIYKKKEF